MTYQLPQVPTKMLSRNRKGGFDTVMMPRVNPVDEMQTFYNLYATYNPDLVVTAAHATERNLEMPFLWEISKRKTDSCIWIFRMIRKI